MHDLIKTDKDRNVLEDSGILSDLELAFILDGRCCQRRSSLFSHERRTFVVTVKATHSKWGVFSVRIDRKDFIRNLIRLLNHGCVFREPESQGKYLLIFLCL